jgi:alkylation response protein AidB-like acyl-CoA dehydrogenase
MILENDALELQLQQSIKDSLSDQSKLTVEESLVDIGALCFGLPLEVGGYGLGEKPIIMVCEELGKLKLESKYVEMVTIADIYYEAHKNEKTETLISIFSGHHKCSLLVSTEEFDIKEINGELRINGSKKYYSNLSDYVYLLHTSHENSYVIKLMKKDIKISSIQQDINHEIVNNIELCDYTTNQYFEISKQEVDFVKSKFLLRQSAYLLGLSIGALDQTVTYTNRRTQFNKKLIEFQTIQIKLAEFYCEIEALKLHVEYVIWQSENKELALDESIKLLASVSEKALSISRQCLHYHGAYGMTKESQIQDYYTLILKEAHRYGSHKNLWREATRLRQKNNKLIDYSTTTF